MSGARIDAVIIAAGLLVWAGIFAASWQGTLGVSGKVSDGLLALVAALIAWRIWHAYRRRGRSDG